MAAVHGRREARSAAFGPSNKCFGVGFGRYPPFLAPTLAAEPLFETRRIVQSRALEGRFFGPKSK